MKTNTIVSKYTLSAQKKAVETALSLKDAAKYIAIMAGGVIFSESNGSDKRTFFIKIDEELTEHLSLNELQALKLHIEGRVAVAVEQNAPISTIDYMADRHAVMHGADPKALLSAVKKLNKRVVNEMAIAAAPGMQSVQAFARFVGRIVSTIHPKQVRRMLGLYKLAYM